MLRFFLNLQQLCSVTFYYLPSVEKSSSYSNGDIKDYYSREMLWLINDQLKSSVEEQVVQPCSATIPAPGRKSLPWIVQRFSFR